MQERPWHRHYQDGVPVSVDYEDVPVGAYLERCARRWPDRDGVVFLNGRLSYGELAEEVDRFATALHNLGVEKGTRVAVHLPNLPQTIIASLAILRLGAHAVMTNPLYTEREIEHQWKDADCRVAVLADFLFEQRVRGIRDRLPVKEYVIASIPEYLGFPLKWLGALKLRRMDPPGIARVQPGPGIHFFRRLIRATPPAPPPVEVDMSETAVVQYTGGTTGVSKGALLTHRNLSCNAQQLRAWFPDCVEGGEVMLSAMPLFHIFGYTVCMLWPVAVGATMVVQANPRDIDMTIGNIAKHRVTLFPSVPALFNSINQHPGAQKFDLSSVKSCFSGSAPLPEDVQERFESLTGATIVEGFGLTETSPVVTANPLRGMRKIGSIGIPVPDTDCRIVDPEDGVAELPSGEAGELLVRGPQVMKEYWNRPDETANAVRNGWFYTGDLATMDEDGYFRIVGRKKDMILASGYNIYPDEIDRVLASHPGVSESCTIGVPDPKRGETVKAFVVPQPGAELGVEELEAFAREQLAAYKVPDQWEFRDALPKSSMMKLLRRTLREEEDARRAAASGSSAGAAGAAGTAGAGE